jgi:single-strand DNA-binding protein
MNVVVVSGALSRAPKRQVLPSGDGLVGYEVTTRPAEGPAESVNVVWFDPPDAADAHDAGDEVVVVGRVRRRFFRAGGATVSRTEVVAHRVLPARQRRRVERALHEVAELLVA